MNTVPMITPHSITGISGLDTKPIFFVKMNRSPTPNLVIKGEYDKGTLSQRDVEVSISWASKLMKNVQHSQVNTKVMTPAEIQVFKAAAQSEFNGKKDKSKQLDFACGAMKVTWVKMPLVDNLSDADFTKEVEVKSSLGDTSYTSRVFDLIRFKETIRKFSDDAVWHELGRVLAVDVFNGNNDRFDLKTGRWSNTGNVMFLSAGPTRVIGLDTFDPESGGSTSNLNMRGNVFPELRILSDHFMRRNFAERCTRSVGEVLALWARDEHVNAFKLKVDSPNGPGVMELSSSLLPKLFEPFTDPLEQGLAQGSFALQAYLQQKVRQYAGPAVAAAPALPHRGFAGNHRTPPPRPTALPPGLRPATSAPAKTIPPAILDRMRYLGW